MTFLRRWIAAVTRWTPSFPGEQRLIRSMDRVLGRSGSPTRVTIGGITYSLRTEDIIARRLLYNGTHQGNVVKICSQFMGWRENGVFWDIGANIGAISLPLLNRHSGWRAVCFEPAPAVLANLCINLSLNPILSRRATVVAAPVLNRTDLIEFYTSSEPHNSGVGRLDLSHNTVDNPIYIGGYSGDELVKKWGFPKPSLVKIDVEGFEYEVLVGIRDILNSESPIAVVFELEAYRYESRDVDPEAVIQMLQTLDCDIYLLNSEGKLQPTHGEVMYGDLLAIRGVPRAALMEDSW